MRRSAIPQWFVVVLISLGAVVALTELAVPLYVERIAARAVASSFESVGSVRVRARTLPAVGMLFGRFDDLSVDLSDAVYSGFRFNRIWLQTSDARIPLARLQPESSEGAKALEQASLTCIVTDWDVNQWLARREDVLRALEVRFLPGLVQITGGIRLGSISYELSSTGHVVVESGNGTGLRYVVDSLSVDNAKAPEFIMDALADKLGLSFRFLDLPFGFSLTSVRVEDRVAYVFGRALGAEQ